MFADGVPPDVAGYGLDGIGRAKNIVIVTFLPKTVRRGFAEFEGCALLEEADEFKEICLGVRAFSQ